MFNLIDWAERTGQLTELVAKAHKANPGNARLRAFAATMPGVSLLKSERFRLSRVQPKLRPRAGNRHRPSTSTG